MRRSTSSLIAEQCNLIDRNIAHPKVSRRRIHDILSDQISSLNSSGSLILSEPIVEQATSTSPDVPLACRPEATKCVPTRPPKKVVSAPNKGCDTSFLQLLTGDAIPEGGTVMSAQARLRQHIAQTHVMKCLGGFKYLEGNAFDNFVVSSLPRLETHNSFKST
ncbi:hypothetical protein X943_001494 [Babesia divergens]|uniref:Uncharacterized protein n=1 Tax=Babesia divergens TaxID=32595 RepID=A0AAD9LGR4_BABDI|nr:hypothetical protein X943_001494 [Babesia divergens]